MTHARGPAEYRPPLPLSYPDAQPGPFVAPPAHDDQLRDVDPLTDSAAHRLGLGTMIRVYQSDGQYIDVGLLTLRNLQAGIDVLTWRDVVDALGAHHDLECRAPRRRFIAGWSITHAEVLSDPDGGHPRTSTTRA